MKKVFCAALMVVLVILCGCSRGETGGIPAGDEGYTLFSDTAEVHIFTEGEPGDEYIQADIMAKWGDSQISETAEIKLRGNSSRESAKKAYTIKFGEELALMGMDPGKKWAIISDPFDKSLLRPAVGFTYAKALGIEYTPDIRLCDVWLNDKYMGLYTAAEPIEAGDGRVGIDPDGGDFLLERNLDRYEDDKCYIDSPAGLRFEVNEPEELTQEQRALCLRLLAEAEEAIFTSDYRVYGKYIDVASFVDFYIFNEMIKDVDFGEYSTRYYFKDGILHAGPPWDLDLTQGNVSPDKEEYKFAEYNNAEGTGDESGDSTKGLWLHGSDYYYWLCQDPLFNELVAQRWAAVREITGNLAEENGLGESLINRLLEAHVGSMEANFGEAGWAPDVPENASEWQEPAQDHAGNVEMLKIWLIKRANYLDTQLNSENFVNFR